MGRVEYFATPRSAAEHSLGTTGLEGLREEQKKKNSLIVAIFAAKI
jgi:hypothetical protein